MNQLQRDQQKKSVRGGSQPKADRPLDRVFGRKRVGYRTSKRFLRNVFRRNPAYRQTGLPHTARPRSLGGHR